MATGAPGGAVYDNVVEYNYVAGNGLSGVTVHSHSPGEDLNGNVIKGNVIGTNNLDGDFDFSPLVDASTTGCSSLRPSTRSASRSWATGSSTTTTASG